MLEKSRNVGVKHWIRGKDVWQLGVMGFFVRKRGLIVSSILPIVLMGTPFWWPETIPGQSVLSRGYLIEVSLGESLIITVIISIIVGYGSLFYANRRTRRSLNLKHGLHELVFELRESVCRSAQRIPQLSGSSGENELQFEYERLSYFSDRACVATCNYVSELVGDEDISCAIRLAEANSDSEMAELHYTTIGRGGNYNKGREQSSEPIERSKGLPAYFLDDAARNCEGVVFVYDLASASQQGICYVTENDKQYGEDVRYKAVSPIYGWNGSKMDLLGLLYITSPNRSILRSKHVDLYRLGADALATAYTAMFAIVDAASSGSFSGRSLSSNETTSGDVL